MKKIPRGYILPSAAIGVPRRRIRSCDYREKPPVAGDVVYGTIVRTGQHSSLENASGRIHMIHDGTKAILVFGNRYAPDFYEGVVPAEMESEVDLLARSGLIGIVRTKNSIIKDPTRVRISGYVCGDDGEILNTTDFPRIKPRTTERKSPRAKMILVCGTSMNSGKSTAAAACCWALSSAGYNVRAAKVTGTASLKDILLMNDSGADPYADFTYLGYPSTYLLPRDVVISIFDRLDRKYANNPRNFWVVEFADGVNQRETAMLLESALVRSRIHKFVFCATDAFGAVGGLRILREQFGIVPDALSGICSSSPLHLRELEAYTSIPVFSSTEPDIKQLAGLLAHSRDEAPVPATAQSTITGVHAAMAVM